MLARPVDIAFKKSDLVGNNIAAYWASNAYSRINNLLRNYSIDILYKSTPSAFVFLQEYFKYFYQQGINQTELAQKCKYIYRGVKRVLALGIHNEHGLTATSMSKEVAIRFATASTMSGTLLRFKTSTLPQHVPFIIIDEGIEPVFQEKEVLLLPGTFTYSKQISERELLTTYVPNVVFVQSVLNKSPPKIKTVRGGMNSEVIDLQNKLIIMYRCIQKRAPDVLGVIYGPTQTSEVGKCMRQMKDALAYYDQVMNLIPEVQDIQQFMRECVKPNRTSAKKSSLYLSYFAHFAIYDPVTKTVLTTNAFLPLLDSTAPIDRQDEIKKVICAYFGH